VRKSSAQSSLTRALLARIEEGALIVERAEALLAEIEFEGMQQKLHLARRRALIRRIDELLRKLP